MQLLDLLYLVLATLYTAHVLTTKAGPFGWFEAAREKTRDRLGALLDCIWCAAFWVALALMAIYLWLPYGEYAIYVLAIAGAALALRTYSGANHG